MVKRLVKRIKRKDEEAERLSSSRITNETVAEHREQILAGGRKFKYPIQYARHRLLINSIIVFFVALVVAILFLWSQLYIVQNTGNLFYRVTQLAPLPVASVDGYPVPYNDYLMQYRSSIHWLQQKSRGFSTSSADSKRQEEHFKRQSLDQAIENAYAQKIAKENNITNPNVIYVGLEIKLPSKDMAAQVKSEMTMTAYEVQSGDTLFKVAEKAYGDGSRWAQIARANKIGYLPNGNPLIYSGSTLVIPR